MKTSEKEIILNKKIDNVVKQNLDKAKEKPTVMSATCFGGGGGTTTNVPGCATTKE